MKILHTADWHIGQYNGRDINGTNGRLADILSSLDALISIAQTEDPDIIVVAGDIYHSERVWAARALQEVNTVKDILRRLASIAPVVVIRGTPSHDGYEQITALRGMDNVFVSTVPEVLQIPTSEGCVSIATLPGMDKGYYRATNPGVMDENEDISNQLKSIVVGLAAQAKILVGHYMIDGAEGSNQSIFAKYEPVVYQDSLSQFDLCLFGHVHKPQRIGNAFYSGSIQAINFTDEGQAKGFYIHDEDHRFVPLTTRKFLTIRLDDIQVEQYINGVVPELVQDSYNCVVRVLYSCTDEHNLQFNRAALESDLYAAGAHWVQEITPEKITVSVKTDVYSDSPMENLKAYYPDEPEIYGLAEPIIAESESKTISNHGVFTPLEIEVKNYRNYTAEKFDYKSINFCTVNGENGAGKSSLFMDSMLDALYEEPRDGDLTGWIKNGEKSGAIVFTFAVGGKTYRISRTRQKSGKATLGLAEFTGEWEDRSGINLRDTQDKIIQTIGIDSQTLKACALIMQDQYGIFLTADKEARMQVLGDILGLKNYEHMEDLTAALLTEENRKLRNLSEEIAKLESVPDEDLDARETNDRENIAQIDLEISEINSKLESEKLKRQAWELANKRADKLDEEIASLDFKSARLKYEKDNEFIKSQTASAIISKKVQLLEAVQESEKSKKRIEELSPKVIEFEHIGQSIDRLERESADLTKRGEGLEYQIFLKGKRKSEIEAILESNVDADHYKYEQASGDLRELESHYEEWQELTDSANRAAFDLSTASSTVRQGLESIAQKIMERKRKSELIETSGCPNDFPCKFLKDAIEARDSLPGLYAEQEKLQKDSTASIDSYVKKHADALLKLSACLYSNDKKSSLALILRSCERAEKIYQQQKTLRVEIAGIDEQILTLKESLSECRERVKLNDEQLAKLNQSIGDALAAVKETEKLKDDIECLMPGVELAAQIPVFEERYSSAMARISQNEKELDEINSEITKKQDSLRAERSLTFDSSVENKLHLLSIEANKRRDMELLELGIIRVKREEREKQIAKLTTLKSELQVVSKLVSSYDKLKKAFSQEGIPHNIIRSVVPMLEATASNILSQMTHGKSSVEIVTEKVLKSNAKKEVTALDIIINDSETGRLNYLSRSGGERVKASLSVILALSEIKATKSGARIGFLFIDEPPYLDSNGMEAYCDALETIQRRYGNLKILAITHDPAMKSRFPQSVDIIKTLEGSKIRG